MTERPTPNRCRLVLIAPQGGDTEALRIGLEKALSGGDVASLIIPQHDMDEASFQAHAAALVPVAQQYGAAAIIAGDTRIAGRVRADGVHLDAGKRELADAIDRLQDKMVVGTGGVRTRDEALELGETGPDYMFFGRFGYDTKDDPHPRNLNLARWWAEMVEIPCIVLGGASIESAGIVAATGAEFVALGKAIFDDGKDPAEQVRRTNALLDRDAPRLTGTP